MTRVNPFKYRLAYVTIIAIEVWDRIPTDDEYILGQTFKLLAATFGVCQIVALGALSGVDANEAREYAIAQSYDLLRSAFNVRDWVGPSRFDDADSPYAANNNLGGGL